jgi:hypothetical protein
MGETVPASVPSMKGIENGSGWVSRISHILPTEKHNEEQA